MKIFKLATILVAAMIGFAACQKQLDFDLSAPSVGTLKKDGFGNCSPSAINGIYQKDSVLTADNFIDVNVNVTAVGTYTIKSDTINGFSFKGTGTLGKAGSNVVRLYGSGKPLASGVSSFTVTYGTSTCVIDVTVIGAGGGAAIYTLGGSPGACSGFTLGSGTYNAGQILVAANTVLTNVNVTGLGTFDLGTDTVNGIYFRASGVFTNAGVQSITLKGTGTPVASGTYNYKLTNGATTCTFSITVGGGGPAAVYVLGGNPGACTGTTIAGTYKQGQALTSANTVIVDVTVTTAGSYNLSTTSVNGVVFSSVGTFATTGPQTVTLVGSGTPTSSGLKTHIINGASTTCSFDITYGAPAPPATFTLSGAPGNCAPMSVNGTYTAGTALNSTNTITVEVNVSVVGSYTLTTGSAVNGMTFSSSGIFTSTGLQNVNLNGSGTPTAAGTFTITPQAGASTCTVDVTVDPPSAPPGILKCKVNGTLIDFSTSAEASVGSIFPPQEILIITGDAVSSTANLGIQFTNNTGAVTPGTYNQTSPNKEIRIIYTDAAGTAYIGITPVTNITFVLTSLTSLRAIGTFSGTVLDISTGASKTITEGVFDVPVF